MANNWLLVSFVHCMLNRQNWVTFTESYMHAIQKLFEVGYLIWLFESFWMVKVFAWLQRSLSGQIKLMYLCHNTVGLKPLGGEIKEEDQGSSKTTEMSFHEIQIGATNADCSNNIVMGCSCNRILCLLWLFRSLSKHIYYWAAQQFSS